MALAIVARTDGATRLAPGGLHPGRLHPRRRRPRPRHVAGGHLDEPVARLCEAEPSSATGPGTMASAAHDVLACMAFDGSLGQVRELLEITAAGRAAGG
jgi:hypothetical protein